eukprot:1455254-Rhodomonas_salina.1
MKAAAPAFHRSSTIAKQCITLRCKVTPATAIATRWGLLCALRTRCNFWQFALVQSGYLHRARGT